VPVAEPGRRFIRQQPEGVAAEDETAPAGREAGRDEQRP
jgi:hypothetical protein